MKQLKLQNRKNQNIVGNLEKPKGASVGTCIIQHGYGGYKEQVFMQVMKDVFLKNGFTTFIFDATNSFGESDGRYEDARPGLHCKDLEDVILWAKKQDWFVEPLALTGHSMGGYSVAIYAEKYPDEVAYCAPIAPVVSGALLFKAKEEAEPGVLKKWEESGWLEKKSTSVSGRIKRKPWGVMTEYLDHDLFPLVYKLTMPMFLFVGSEDKSVSSKYVQKFFDAIPEGNKTIKILEGASHVYKSEEDLRALGDALDGWLKGELGE